MNGKYFGWQEPKHHKITADLLGLIYKLPYMGPVGICCQPDPEHEAEEKNSGYISYH